jgi:GT2 family glycosyltransferase
LELSIIIVNYNVRCFLEQCLHTVAKAVATIEAEVIIVDNASGDGSLDYLKPLFPSYRFLQNLENTGFAKANNQAFKISKGRFVLFLNPDTLLPEDCLLNCLDFIKTHSNPGAIGIRMLDGSGQFLPESKRAFPSPIAAFYKLIGLSALFPKSAVFNHYSLGHLNDQENQIVDVLAGAFMLVPQTVLLETGGFDEQFFMYGEDIDLSYRIQKAGFINHYFAQSSIIHFKGESTRKGSLNYVLLFYNAMRIFVQKNYRGGKAGVFAFFIQLAIFFRAIFSLVNQLVFLPLRKIVRSPKPVGSNYTIAIIAADGYCPDLNAYFKLSSDQANKSSPPNKLVFFSISNCNMLLNDSNFKTILFCEGNGLTWKKIIETVSVFSSSQKTLLFHSKNSYSIVGSDSRETSGKAVSIVK